MKNLELQNYGILELISKDMFNVNGGCNDWICIHHFFKYYDQFVDGLNAANGNC